MYKVLLNGTLQNVNFMLCEFHFSKNKVQGGWEMSSLVGQRLLPRDSSALLKGVMCPWWPAKHPCASFFLLPPEHTSLLPKGDNPKTSQVTVSSLKLRMSCPLLISHVAPLALVTYKLKGQVIWIPHLCTQYRGGAETAWLCTNTCIQKEKTGTQSSHWPLIVVSCGWAGAEEAGRWAENFPC